jgi:3-hydroxyisobutyrate dehydrogenase-like beta-hydroxyacid dehydrogenase
VALPQLLEGKFAANFSIDLLVKDLTLATKLGLESKSPMLLGNMVRELYQIVGNELGQDADITKILRLFERQSGVTVVPG